MLELLQSTRKKTHIQRFALLRMFKHMPHLSEIVRAKWTSCIKVGRHGIQRFAVFLRRLLLMTFATPTVPFYPRTLAGPNQEESRASLQSPRWKHQVLARVIGSARPDDLEF